MEAKGRNKRYIFIGTAALLILALVCAAWFVNRTRAGFVWYNKLTYAQAVDDQKQSITDNSFLLIRLAQAAEERTAHRVLYDPSYIEIEYPGGDIPHDKGVCTDVVIRAYRTLGIDLQVLVHEDMKANFNRYPDIWGLEKADPNIDHRRVPNLMTFFGRYGTVLPISSSPENYTPGDIVAWNLGGGVTHIGIVAQKRSKGDKRYLIVHNIGAGPKMEDVLFDWEIIGHYRFDGKGSF